MRAILFTLLAVFMCATAVFAGSFKDNGNETITDLTTNLMWQQCTYGLSGANCATGAVLTITWEASIVYCETLSHAGFTDWRLPHIKELRSIADSTTYSPAINAVYFPNTDLSRYWSSTSSAADTTAAMYVHFGLGYASAMDKAYLYAVRCVRGQ